MYDYLKDVIKSNNERVTVLAVVGLAVESFLYLAYHARHGFNVLDWHHVKSVTFYKVMINGNKYPTAEAEVKVPRPDVERALNVARIIAERLEKFGFRIFDAVVPELNGSRKSVGDHDLLAERRRMRGRSSIEIKLRTITKDRYIETVRKQVRHLSYHGRSKVFWTTAISKPNHKWVERVVVLAIFPTPLSDHFEIRCEALPAMAEYKPENWQVLFGWEPPLPMPRPAPKAAAAPAAQAKAAARTRPATAAPAAASGTNSVAERARKRKFEHDFTKIRKQVTAYGVMGSVSDLLTQMETPAAKRAKPTVGEKLPRWSRTWSWPANSWGQWAAFRARTGGGLKGFGASKAALDDIHKFLSE